MPPHDRLCWRLKPLLQSQTTHISKHHEPLLFLYPRWYTTTVTEPQTSADVSHDPPKEERRRKIVDPRNRHIRQARVIPSEVAQDQETTSQPQTSPENPLDSRPSSGLVRKIIGKRNYEVKKVQRKWQLREEYKDYKDWRTSLEALQRHTLNKPSNHVKQLEVLKMPEGMFGWYPGDLKELFLEIFLFTECHVQIPVGGNEGVSDGSKFHSLVLAGTPTTIRMARTRLNDEIRVRSDKEVDAGGSMGAFTTTTTILKREKATARAVWSQFRARPWATLKPSDMPTPEKWSIVTFANRVEDLVSQPMPRTLQSRIYDRKLGPNQESHFDAVTDALQDLFLSPAMLPFISPYSCAIAFPFLMKHRKLPAMRRIIEFLDTHDFPFTIGTFNPCLKAARDAGDLHNFYFVLRLMLDRHVYPDWQSWSALVQLVNQTSRSDARMVLKNMRKKGILAAAPAKMEIAAAFVKADFTDWVERGGGTTAFFEMYDKYFEGTEWLSENVANRMLGVRAERGQFGDAFSIIDVLVARGKRPNVVSLNTLLTAATAQRNHRAALEAVERLVGDEASIGVRPDKITFDQLFKLAWRRCEYNTLRVVWRYACMYGEVSSALQEAFEGTVALYPSSSGSRLDNAVGAGSPTLAQVSRLKLFRSLAAKTAVGLSGQLGNGTSEEVAEDDIKHMLIELSQQTPHHAADEIDSLSETSHASRKRKLLDLVKNDMQQVRRRRPLLPLAEMLRIAREMDAEWTGLGVRKTPNLKWILENAVQIPITVGPVPALRRLRGTYWVRDMQPEESSEQDTEQDVDQKLQRDVAQILGQDLEPDVE